METFLTLLIAYILGVSFYTAAVRRSATNRYVKNMRIWPIIWDGAKGMAIGFAIVAAIIFAISAIVMLI